MISGIQQNVNFQGGVTTGTNAAPYMNAQYQYAQGPAADTVELSGKKGGKAKKAVLGTVVAVAVAAATLFGLVKSGKLQKPTDTSKFTGKLQDYAYTAGSKLNDYYTKAADSKAGKWISENVVDKVKGLFHKKADTVAETAAEVAAS